MSIEDLPAPPSKSKSNISDLPAPPKSGDSSVKPLDLKFPGISERKPTLGERVADIGKETGFGGVAALTAPEILMGVGKGLQKISPTTAPGALKIPALIGKFGGKGLEMLGRAAETERRTLGPAKTFGLGALAGGSGEVGAQTTEMLGGGKAAQETARLVTGIGSSMAPSAVVGVIGKITGASKGLPVNQIYREIVAQTGLREETMTQAQKKYVQQVAQQISAGTMPMEQTAEGLQAGLRVGAYDLRAAYQDQAAALESQADQLVKQADAFAKSRSADAASRVDALNRQFNAKASEMMNTAQQSAAAIRKEAQDKVTKIRSTASYQGGVAIAQAERESAQILQKAEQEAAALVKESNDRITRLKGIADEARKKAGTFTETSAQTLRGVGEPMTRTQRGEALRSNVENRLKSLKGTRDANAEKNKAAAFSDAASKEAQGQSIQGTKAYTELKNELDRAIKAAPLPEIKNQLTKIRQAITGERLDQATGVVVGDKTPFESMEVLRRYMRDRSWGVPAEGYDAIGQQQAGDIADGIEKMMTEFSAVEGKPNLFKQFLEQYRRDSEPLKAFKTSLGKTITGKEDFDMARFSEYASEISDQVFQSKGGVDLMIEMMGGNRAAAEQFARAHVADKLLDADAKTVRNFLRDERVRDWLPSFPQLQQDLLNAVDRMERVTGLAAKRQTLANALRVEATGIQTRLPTELTKISTGAEKKAAARTKEIMTQAEKAQKEAEAAARREAAEVTRTGETRAGQVLTEAEAAQKASEAAVRRQAGKITTESERETKPIVTRAGKEAEELRRQAGELSQKGEALYNKIVSNKFDELATRDLILSGDRSLWEEISPIINKNPSSRRMLSDFTKSYLGKAAERSPRQAQEVWQTRIRPAMQEFGLANQSAINELDSQIAQLSKIMDAPTRNTLMQKALTRALYTEGGRPFTSIFNMATYPFMNRGQ